MGTLLKKKKITVRWHERALRTRSGREMTPRCGVRVLTPTRKGGRFDNTAPLRYWESLSSFPSPSALDFVFLAHPARARPGGLSVRGHLIEALPRQHASVGYGGRAHHWRRRSTAMVVSQHAGVGGGGKGLLDLAQAAAIETWSFSQVVFF
jgi:hypothetical protein